MHGSPLMLWELDWYDLRLIDPSEFMRSDFTVARIAHARLQHAPVFIRGNEPRFITAPTWTGPTNFGTSLPPGTLPQPLFNVPTPQHPMPRVYASAEERERLRYQPVQTPPAAAVEPPPSDPNPSGTTAPQPDADSEEDAWAPTKTKAPIPKQPPAQLPVAAWGTEPPNPIQPKAPPTLPLQPTAGQAVRTFPEDPWKSEPSPARQPKVDEATSTPAAEPTLPATVPTVPEAQHEPTEAPEADTAMTDTATPPDLPTAMTSDEINALQGTTVVRHNTPEATHAWTTACPFRSTGYWPGTDHSSPNCYVCNNHAMEACEQCKFSFCRKHFTSHS